MPQPAAPNPQQQQPKMPRFNLNWLYLVIIAGLAVMFFQNSWGESNFDKEVSYSDIKTYITQGYAKEVVVDKAKGTISLVIDKAHIRDVFHVSTDQVGASPTVSTRYPSTDKVEEYLTQAEYTGKVTYKETRSVLLNLLSSVLPILIFVGLWFFLMRYMSKGSGGMGGIFNVGKSKAQVIEKGEGGTGVTFKDVAGLEGS